MTVAAPRTRYSERPANDASTVPLTLVGRGRSGASAASGGPVQFGAARSVLVATLLLIVVNAVFIELRPNTPRHPLPVQVLHHVYDAGHHLALGLIAAALAALCKRLRGPRARLDPAILLLFSLALAALTLPDDYANFARRTAPTELWATALLVVLVGVSAGAIVLSALSAAWVAKRWRVLALGVGVWLLVFNHQMLRNDYPGVHFLMAFIAGAFVVGALTAAPLPAWWPTRHGALGRTLMAAFAGFTLVVWPSPIVLHELLRFEGSVATRLFARARHRERTGTARVSPAQRPWFVSRATLAPIPPSGPALLPGDAVVVLVTIDALRADVLNTRRYDAKIPTLARLRDESVSFTMARSPSSQTMMGLGTLFAGTYFSQQYWTRHPKQPQVWPHEDPTRRFPELLVDSGVATATYAGVPWLTNAFGVVRGFQEERFIRSDTKLTPAAGIVDVTLQRLSRHGSGPLFLFIHLLDAHAPYEGAGAAPFERYLGELGVVDAQIARVLKVLRAPKLASRSALIVSADHGEGFGEHGANNHGTSLYEEQIRVPLLMSLPGVAPRAVNTPVSLVDLGPTILDLFGVPTPGYFMGESLTGFLRGTSPTLTRPIAAEVRLMHMLIDGDGKKSIVDDRTHGSELYDLERDPAEGRNLNDGGPSAADRLALLDLFFSTHRIRRPGYKLPFRP